MSGPDRVGSEKRLLVLLGGGVFLYAVLVAVVVQGVIAPRLPGAETVPPGMLAGMDTPFFHELAVEQAEAIRSEGWSAWEWNPGWQPAQPVGILSAVYAVFGPSLLFVIPLTAFLHAAAALLLYAVLRALGFGRLPAVVGVLPLVFFPSTLTWVSQFHKDNLFLPGFFLFLLGWTGLVRERGARWVGAVLVVAAGAVLMAAMRPYALTFAALAGGAGLLAAVGVAGLGRRLSPGAGLLRILGGGLVLGSLLLFSPGGPEGPAAEPSPPSSSGAGGSATARDTALETAGAGRTPAPAAANPPAGSSQGPPTLAWQPTPWLPGPVDNAFRQLATARAITHWMFPEAGSRLDEDRRFTSAPDLFAYLPRALTIGLLAPFPRQWVERGLTPTGTLERRVVAGEMVLAYGCFLALGLGLWRRLPAPRVGVVLLCGLFLLPYVYALSAVGSLYRLRFGPWIVLVALGAAVVAEGVRKYRARQRSLRPARA